VVVQGQLVNDKDVVLGDGEALVEIPAELLANMHSPSV
jgi:regulator of RNase E activity RraA